MVTEESSETLVIFCHTTLHHIPEDFISHNDGLNNPESHDVNKSEVKTYGGLEA
jgi:hypothetical protein